MAGTPEGHIESVFADDATLVGNLGDGTKGGTAAPPHIGVQQLRARKREIDKARHSLIGSTRRSIGRLNAAEMVRAHAPWPVT